MSAKEEYQEMKMMEIGLSATEQIQKQVDRSLEPKLELLLAKKVKTNAPKIKPTKKDQHYKFKSESSSTKGILLKRSLTLEITP